jgi:hypothetical protein
LFLYIRKKSLKSQDDLVAQEVKAKLIKCVQEYKMALGLGPASNQSKASEVDVC